MSVQEVHYANVTEARKNFGALIDAAEAGVPATVQRDKRRTAVVEAERLRQFLVSVRPARAEVVALRHPPTMRTTGAWSRSLTCRPTRS
jgi:antitoxin (DNA-binding transcriptional repressor) of toxin-antitoxin stability system